MISAGIQDTNCNARHASTRRTSRGPRDWCTCTSASTRRCYQATDGTNHGTTIRHELGIFSKVCTYLNDELKPSDDMYLLCTYIYRCLEETNWDFQRAVFIFTELHKQGTIPAEAFVK